MADPCQCTIDIGARSVELDIGKEPVLLAIRKPVVEIEVCEVETFPPDVVLWWGSPLQPVTWTDIFVRW